MKKAQAMRLIDDVAACRFRNRPSEARSVEGRKDSKGRKMMMDGMTIVL